jgi:hypothetical protein
MSQHASPPNRLVGALYEELGELLERGDDVFIEEGPELLKDAIEQPGFFDGVETEHAPPGEYTRAKVIGEPGRHVIRYMEWPPEFSLLPHEHHGRPCFEVLVDGLLSVVDMEPQPLDEDRYTMEVVGTEITRPGESAVIDPRENEVHAVYSPVRSRSLHIYPEDNYHACGYVLQEETDRETDIYTRERFELRDEG